MRANWKRPAPTGLQNKLREVVQGLREAAPLLVEAQVKAFEGMIATARLACQPRRLSAPQPNDQGEPHE